MYKQYVAKLKYHLWRLSRAAELVLRPEEKTHREYVKEIRSQDSMKALLKYLDSLPPYDPNVKSELYDPYEKSWFVGVIPYDWEQRINDKIKEKENQNVVD